MKTSEEKTSTKFKASGVMEGCFVFDLSDVNKITYVGRAMVEWGGFFFFFFFE